jgi:hypothetical protein
LYSVAAATGALIAACVIAMPSARLYAQETPAAPATTEPAAPAPSAPAEGTPAPSATEAPATTPAAPVDTTGAAAVPATAPGEGNVDARKLVEDYWHYGKIARYDLANASGQKLLASGADPAQVLLAFEQTAADRKDNLDEWILRFQQVEQTRQTTEQIIKVLNQGRYTRRSEPNFIMQNIERLTSSSRGYQNGIAQLRDSGELAVPFMIQYLRDPTKTQYHAAIRRALRDLGRYSLNPLVAATDMKDADVLAMVCTTLGDLGYDVAVPYLARVAQQKALPNPTRQAATDAIQRITGQQNNPQSLNTAALYYQLGEKFYYDTAAIRVDERNPVGYMWYWDNTKGLIKTDVPTPIFNELMAMRQTEFAMKLGGSTGTGGDALSLWLASNYKREVELPQGSTDPTREPNQPDAHYYGVQAGAQYLNAALNRALTDRNSQVALKVILSLQGIAGRENTLPGGHGPLVDAMAYPDRIIRYESAFAVAGSLPQTAFEGKDRVVPLLAEALSQTGQSSVLIAAPTQEAINALAEGLKAAGYTVGGGTSADAVATAATEMNSVDVVIISDELAAPEVERLLNSRNQPVKLAGASKLVMVKSDASPYAARAQSDPMISTTQARAADALKPAIDQARSKAGGLPVDPAIATKYATRAGELLARLAISNTTVFDLATAEPSLLASLTDQRPEIVKLSGNVLAFVNTTNGQAGLLTVGAEEKTADDVKISLLKSLSTNAKYFGNKLEPQQIETLAKLVEGAPNLEVRSAAAEAHGALNLPPDQAKGLILKQAKIGW